MFSLKHSLIPVLFILFGQKANCNGSDTEISSATCSYSFQVNREDGCSVNDGALTQLQTTVSELQEQVTSLLQQNTAVLQQNVQLLEDNAFWRRIAQEKLNTSTSAGPGSHVGSVFTRWGRTVCSRDSSLIYAGHAAGSHYTHTGGSSEILCLPEEPQWGQYVDGFQGGSYLYGSEYQTGYNGYDIFLEANSGGQSLNDHDVPCAVCYISGRSTVQMYPAMLQCPDGWSGEYKGYLMANHYRHKGNIKPLCVDEAPEISESGSADQNGAIFNNMEAQCGSLPCPKYVSGRELTCAVCSR